MAFSGTFGVVATADDTEVTSWQWEESADSANWQVVGTILTDTSGQGTKELTVNSATAVMDGTYVRCRAFYSGGSTLSNPTTLTVIPA